MKRIIFLALIVFLATIVVQTAVYSQCETVAPALDIAFDSEVSAVDDEGIVYLSLVGGDTPSPNDCGLNPSNDPAAWMGWGGPLDSDNMSIGEGIGTRNLVTINGIRYERGIGTHGTAVVEYDLTGDDYIRFEAVVGMDDEKDGADFAGDCGHGGTATFTFSIDGTVVAESDVLSGVVEGGGENAPGEEIKFDVPPGSQTLTIEIGDAGDGIGCDHANVADGKLITSRATSVEAKDKLSTTWGELKSSY